MLRSLRIKNLAIIDDLTWELGAGLNVLTGETGAGKSILIDAFNLLLGERADKTLIRHGADQCVVEAELEAFPAVQPLLDAAGIEPSEDGLFLKRSFNAQGQNRQFINGSPTTLQVLRTLGEALVDLHGPHDHQSLLSVQTQLDALDTFAGLGKQLQDYHALYKTFLTETAELEALRKTEGGDWSRQVGFLEFQVNEIEAAALQPDEEEGLQRDYQLATHHQRLVELSSSLRLLLSEAEENILDDLYAVGKLVREWQQIDPQASSLLELYENARLQLEELSRAVEGRIEEEGSPQELDVLRARLDQIQALKYKYGASIPQVLARLEELRQELKLLLGREERIQKLQASLSASQAALRKLAEKLSAKRQAASGKLSKEITAQLRELGFNQAEFSLSLTSLEALNASGLDRVEFLFLANRGEALRPLRAVASSGEMARVMLAIKTVLAQQDQVPILIFDEIDANVGGETAVTVGKKLRGLGQAHQVLCITHLPQVAAAADRHFRVEKITEGNRTVARLLELHPEARIEELCRMLGGKSSSARGLAQTLLGKGS